MPKVGNTETVKIKVAGQGIFLKREDQNPTGSYKDRGTVYKIPKLFKSGIKEIVMSSSGNAAISMLNFASKYAIKVNVVLAPTVNPEKLKLIEKLVSEGNHNLIINEHPRQTAAQISGRYNIQNIKASIDADLLAGFESLGEEIGKEGYTDIFVPCSSGTALVGMYNGIKKLGIKSPPRIHACQTSRVFAIAGTYDRDFVEEQISLADAIVDRVALRKGQIDLIIKETDGSAWVLDNVAIQDAYNIANDQLDSPISFTSSLSIAGFLKAKSKFKTGKKVLCIASGR